MYRIDDETGLVNVAPDVRRKAAVESLGQRESGPHQIPMQKKQ